MKLAHKFLLIYVTATLLVFIAMGYFFYNTTFQMLDNQATKNIDQRKIQLVNYLRNLDTITASTMSLDKSIQIYPFPTVIRNQTIDTTLQLAGDSLPTLYRQFVFTYKKKNTRYKITISEELSTIRLLQIKAVRIEMILLFILLTVMIVITWFVTFSLLKPLTQFLSYIESFDIQQPKLNANITSSTSELVSLSSSFTAMMKKIKTDFDNLRLFTENASHEMQTPLTVIDNSMELLVQKENYDPSQIKLLNNILNSVIRLKKIHMDLLLLSRLESNYYSSRELVDFKKIVEEIIYLYKSTIESKGFSMQLDLQECSKISNKECIFILFNNLIGNAVKHGLSGSQITVFLDANQFKITNKGPQLNTGVHDRIFERFYKESRSNDSNGMGLAIVKQICLNLNYSIKYFTQDELHCFEIFFVKSN